jgi:hypothetical protein
LNETGHALDRIRPGTTLNHRLVINAVIYSELSIAFARIEELEAVVNEASLTLEEIPREALTSAKGQQAARATGFLHWRARGRERREMTARCTVHLWKLRSSRWAGDSLPMILAVW